MSVIYGRNQTPKHVLHIEINTKFIFILKISLIGKIFSYYVFPENIKTALEYDVQRLNAIVTIYKVR